MARDGGDGWRAWQALPRLAGGALAVPVVVGFVALGAVVVAARSVRGLARQTWARLPWPRGQKAPGPGSGTSAEPDRIRRDARGR